MEAASSVNTAARSMARLYPFRAGADAGAWLSNGSITARFQAFAFLLLRLGTLFQFFLPLLCAVLRGSFFGIRLMFGVNRRNTGQAQNGGDKENDKPSHVVSPCSNQHSHSDRLLLNNASNSSNNLDYHEPALLSSAASALDLAKLSSVSVADPRPARGSLFRFTPRILKRS
jgi:hypothetical protein